MIRVCLSGARGRMGRILTELLREDPALELTAALERPDHPEIGQAIAPKVRLEGEARPAIERCDVLLDFGLPPAVREHLPLCREAKKPLVTGATGFDEQGRSELSRAAESIPIVWSANMSRGVQVLAELARRAAAMLGGEYDAEIFEIHHRHKADAPSGTALLLAERIRKARGGEIRYGREGRRAPDEIGLCSARGGDVVGEHQVMFFGGGEQILLIHRASSREHFARGALQAVRWIVGRSPGLYGMDDVFGGA